MLSFIIFPPNTAPTWIIHNKIRYIINNSIPFQIYIQNKSNW